MKPTAPAKKLCIRTLDKSETPMMYIVVEMDKVNQLFQGIELATEFVQGNTGSMLSIHMDKQSAFDDMAIPRNTNHATVTPEKQSFLKITRGNTILPFAQANNTTDPLDVSKPECFDINKLEQQQQSIANDADIIQPFQPPKEQHEQLKSEIQENNQAARCT